MPSQHPRLTVGTCPICSQLAPQERSFSKYGAPELDRPLPAAASQLEFVSDPSAPDPERHHLRRCPACQTYYAYHAYHDYYINGSEDEEELTRLAPAQARHLFTPKQYRQQLAAARANLSHPSAATRRFAARCLASHHQAQGDAQALAALLDDPDPTVGQETLQCLTEWAETQKVTTGFRLLADRLADLCRSKDGEVASRAVRLLKRLADVSDAGPQKPH